MRQEYPDPPPGRMERLLLLAIDGLDVVWDLALRILGAILGRTILALMLPVILILAGVALATRKFQPDDRT